MERPKHMSAVIRKMCEQIAEAIRTEVGTETPLAEMFDYFSDYPEIFGDRPGLLKIVEQINEQIFEEESPPCTCGHIQLLHRNSWDRCRVETRAGACPCRGYEEKP